MFSSEGLLTNMLGFVQGWQFYGIFVSVMAHIARPLTLLDN